MILISRTYSEITPDSAENGEHSDTGFICESAEYSFRELVYLLRDCSQASNYPANGNTFEWYSTEYQTTDYRTGEERQESVHYCRENPARNARYWRLAAIAAGLVKGA